MTTTSEQESIHARAQDAESPAGGNLDKVRDLLFGGQMRDYDRKFARFEDLSASVQSLAPLPKGVSRRVRR